MDRPLAPPAQYIDEDTDDPLDYGKYEEHGWVVKALDPRLRIMGFESYSAGHA